MSLSRRHFFMGSLALPALAQKKPAGETPNILLVLVDNLPAWMLGCYGNKEVRTPSIDRLAQTGTRFLNHFASSPMPGPARAALFTGRTPVQLKDTDAPPAAEPTLGKLLQAAGYATQTVTGGSAAASFVDAQTGSKPFLLTATFSDFAPPYAIGAKFLDGYLPVKFDTFAQVPAASNARDKEMLGGNLLPNLRKAAAAATAIDAEIGALVAALSRKKLLDNTLIIFTAPTGSLLGRHGLWAGGDASDPVNFYDEVIATPMIWSWPARVVPLGTRPEMVSAVDLVPTLCDLTPADLPDKNFSGRSYLPLVEHKPLPKKQPWRQTVFASWRDAGVARDDRYKLVLRGEGKGPNEMYDMKVDPRERVNQFENPQFLTVKTQLTAELTRWKTR
jgi:arylsulfatase A-like enzyme